MKERLIEFLAYLGIGQLKFEKNVGLSRGFVNKVGYSIQKDKLDKISTAYPELDINWLKTGVGSMLINAEKQKMETHEDEGLPLIPFEYIAGYGEDNDGILLNECERYKIPEFKNIGAEFLCRVGGSSMYPKYSSGDILACKKIHEITFFQWGKIYVIDSAQGQMIKRVCEHEDEEKIWLISDNKEKLSNDKEKYAPFAIRKDEIRSLSIVLGAVRME